MGIVVVVVVVVVKTRRDLLGVGKCVALLQVEAKSFADVLENFDKSFERLVSHMLIDIGKQLENACGQLVDLNIGRPEAMQGVDQQTQRLLSHFGQLVVKTNEQTVPNELDNNKKQNENETKFRIPF